MAYTIQYIASVLQCRHKPAGDGRVEHLLTDSRKLIFPATTLFFALAGPQRNGHQYIPELYNRGMRFFVVSELPDQQQMPEALFIQVPDCLLALQQLVAHHRRQFSLPVIGITGSNGKTIVKEWLNQLLEEDYRILRSPKSYNSQIGVPLSVWPLSSHHDLGIFEAGISQGGEMERLRRIIQPSIGIFTNVGEAHSENFVHHRQKINEKLLLFTEADQLIYCKDYPELQEAVATRWQQLNRGREQPAQLINWSMLTEASLQISSIYKEDGNTEIKGNWKGEEVAITIPFADNASVENAIHCWCLLLLLGQQPDTIARKMWQLDPVPMRLELKSGINNCSVINDSYSADISSLRIALDFLAQQRQHDRRTVILSDILQSGRSEKELYQEVAQLLQQRQVNRLIGIGDRISQHHALFDQVPELETRFFKSAAALQQEFSRLSFKEETILLKGARVFELEAIDQLLARQVHQTVMEVNLSALVNNLRQYRQKLAAGTRLMVMVKAFAYGSGSYEIANVLQFHKVDYLAVAYADEGVELRKGGITLPIMIMNPDESAFEAMLQYHLEPELFSIGLFRKFEAFLRKQGIQQYPVHLELETGMNRLGFAEGDIPQLIALLQSGLCKVQSVFSHLVASEDPQFDSFTQEQAHRFEVMSNALQAAIPYPFLRHIANTSGISRHPQWQFDMVRLGIGLYGVDANNSQLVQVSTLRSTVAQLKKLHATETVSYGRRGTLQRDSVIATIRIGYADGYPRSLGNGVGKIWIRGRLAPTVGTICMDMTMIDVTGIADVKEGDDVVLFGTELPVTTVAGWADTIPYDILTGISQRVRRVYYEE